LRTDSEVNSPDPSGAPKRILLDKNAGALKSEHIDRGRLVVDSAWLPCRELKAERLHHCVCPQSIEEDSTACLTIGGARAEYAAHLG
jgi:hypothetical protein